MSLSDVLTAVPIGLFPVIVIGHYLTASSMDTHKRRKAHAKISK